MPSWHCRRISRAPVAAAIARATSVLPTPGLALEQQRLLERDREVRPQRQRPVGQVALGGERGARRLNGLDIREAHAASG